MTGPSTSFAASSKDVSTNKRTSSRRKSVHIREEFNETKTFSVPHDIPYGDLWFTADEFRDIKEGSRLVAKEWRKQGYSKLLKETFLHPRHDAQDHMTAFCMLNGESCMRGLERHCSKEHGDDRSCSKARARVVVLEAQYRLGKEGVKSEELAERISGAYVNACRDAKIFARRMAKADELALHLEDAEDAESVASKCRDILVSCSVGTAQRRMSNYSLHSVNSYDSNKPHRRAVAGFKQASSSCLTAGIA